MTQSDAQIPSAMAKHPLVFCDPPLVRARKIGLWMGFFALFAWCLYDFNFSPERIWIGLGRLGRVVSFMFPPHFWQTWEAWLEVLTALGETIAMAFLGTVRFAIMPQVLPVHLSVLLYNFESNVRSGTILGIVGAGGIGFLLSDRISAHKWDEAWTMIFMIIAMV